MCKIFKKTYFEEHLLKDAYLHANELFIPSQNGCHTSLYMTLDIILKLHNIKEKKLPFTSNIKSLNTAVTKRKF